MRTAFFAVVLPIAAAGCDGQPITGPEAQRVVAQAAPLHGRLPTGILVVVDGVRLAPDKSVSDLDPSAVETVEVIKGAAASRAFGRDGARGAIIITTKRPVAAPPSPK